MHKHTQITKYRYFTFL